MRAPQEGREEREVELRSYEDALHLEDNAGPVRGVALGGTCPCSAGTSAALEWRVLPMKSVVCLSLEFNVNFFPVKSLNFMIIEEDCQEGESLNNYPISLSHGVCRSLLQMTCLFFKTGGLKTVVWVPSGQ